MKDNIYKSYKHISIGYASQAMVGWSCFSKRSHDLYLYALTQGSAHKYFVSKKTELYLSMGVILMGLSYVS